MTLLSSQYIHFVWKGNLRQPPPVSEGLAILLRITSNWSITVRGFKVLRTHKIVACDEIRSNAFTRRFSKSCYVECLHWSRYLSIAGSIVRTRIGINCFGKVVSVLLTLE